MSYLTHFCTHPQLHPQALKSAKKRPYNVQCTSLPMSFMEDIFDNFFKEETSRSAQNSSQNVESYFSPRMDIAESEKHYLIEIDIPGVEEEDVKLELEEQTLTISGEKKQANSEQEDHNWHRTERSFGSFKRVLSLPEGVVSDNIIASFKNGVLSLSIPKKAQKKAKKKTIKIKKS